MSLRRSQSVGRPLTGSKPRKQMIATRTNNPTLISTSMKMLFNRDEQLLLKQPNTKNSRQTDTLTKAQNEFKSHKSTTLNPKVAMAKMSLESTANTLLSRRFSFPTVLYSKESQNSDYNNYSQFESNLSVNVIKSKQSQKYNIINCLPQL